MVVRKRKDHNPRARYPFVKKLAGEFGLSVSHTWKVLSGERESPRRGLILSRQAELLLASQAKSETSTSRQYITHET